MAFTRRNFLKTSSIVAISAGVPLQAFAKSGAATSASSQAGSVAPFGSGLVARSVTFLNKAAFAREMNTSFQLAHPSIKETTVVLREIKDWREIDANNSSAECFSLMFAGPANLPQNTYVVTHRSLGTFSVLIVPSGTKRDGHYYEALFNRLR